MLTPLTSDQLLWGGLLLVVFGVMGLFLFVSRYFSKRRRRKQGESVRRRGLLFGLVELLILFLMIITGLFSMTLVAFQESYSAFTERQPVLRIRAFYSQPQNREMLLQLQWLTAATDTPRVKRVYLRGDQFEIEGQILLWDDFLTALGIKPGYKLTRIRGRFVDVEIERAAQPTIVRLHNEARDRPWQWLFKNASRIPGVRAVFGQTVYTYPDPDKVFELRVSHDGFILQDVNQATWK